MKKKTKRLLRLKSAQFAKAIFERHVNTGSDMDCWQQTSELDAFVNGIRFKNASDLIIYLYDKSYNPRTMTIKHLCRNKKCCNPMHMEIVYKNLIR